MIKYLSLSLLCLVLSSPSGLLRLLLDSRPEFLFFPSLCRSDMFLSDSCLDSRNSRGTLSLGLRKRLAFLGLPCSFVFFICVVFSDGNNAPRYYFRVIIAMCESGY